MQNYFVFIGTGYNCEAWIKKSLESVVTQEFPKDRFKICYTDAKSTDKSFDIANNFKMAGNHEHLVLSQNTERKYQLENIVDMIKTMVPDGAICVSFDGDDWLPHAGVLKKLDSVYTPDVWMTHGSYAQYPTMRSNMSINKPYDEHQIQSNIFRKVPWRGSHLRTWRKELFLKIADADLRDQDGGYYKMAGDLAFMFPMMEMAGFHTRTVEEVMYVYNYTNPLNEARVNQLEINRIEKRVRELRPYQKLDKLYE